MTATRVLRGTLAVVVGLLLVACSSSQGILSRQTEPTSPTETLSQQKSTADPQKEWSRITVLYDREHLREPLEVNGRFFGVADIRDVSPNLQTQGDVIVLLGFNGETYVPLDRYGGAACFEGDCDFSEPRTSPNGSPYFEISHVLLTPDRSARFPTRSYFISVQDGSLVSLLPIDSDGDNWEWVEVTGRTGDGIQTTECSQTEWYAGDNGESEAWCLEFVRRTVRYDGTDFNVVDVIRESNPRPFEVCILRYGENCGYSVMVTPDEQCPDPVQGESYEYSVLPCNYGYWVLVAETELKKLGYPVTDDGYYSAEEIPAVKQAQTDFGAYPDGLIGRYTWTAVFSSLNCEGFDPATGQPAELDFCYDDWNNDGFYGPGDRIPD